MPPQGDAGWGARPGEPRAPGAGGLDEDAMLGLRGHRAAAGIDGPLAGVEGAEGGALGPVLLRDRGPRHRLCGDLPTANECGRRRPG